MDTCCSVHEVPARQRRVLQAVLVINITMFVVEFLAGLAAHSSALVADSVDMLGDAIVYGFSLYVIARGAIWQAQSALLKGVITAAFGAIVVVQVITKVVHGVVPEADVIGVVGGIALAANGFCLALLWRRRTDDINMRSAWICSRNDVVANVGVLVAAGLVRATSSGWPDIVVGLAIAAMFMESAVGIIRDAVKGLRTQHG